MGFDLLPRRPAHHEQWLPTRALADVDDIILVDDGLQVLVVLVRTEQHLGALDGHHLRMKKYQIAAIAATPIPTLTNVEPTTPEDKAFVGTQPTVPLTVVTCV